MAIGGSDVPPEFLPDHLNDDDRGKEGSQGPPNPTTIRERRFAAARGVLLKPHKQFLIEATELTTQRQRVGGQRTSQGNT